MLCSKIDNSLTFISTYSEDTLKLYPFKYQVRIKYEIKDCGVAIDIEVTNKGKEKMYFNIGGHPGFRLPMYDNEKFDDYSVVFEKTEDFDAPTVNLQNGTLDFNHTIRCDHIGRIDLNYKYFEIDAIVIPKVKSREVKLVNKKNKGIRFNYHGFNSLAIWTKPNAPFVCLEPWMGYADHSDSDYNFIKKDDIVTLKANEVYKCGYSVEILD